MLFAVTAASAQDKHLAFGRVWTSTPTRVTPCGPGAFGRYSFTDNWRIEPSLMALLHSGCSIDISVDAQYVFHLGKAGAFIRQWVSRPMTSASGPQAEHRQSFDFEVARNWDLSAGLKWRPMFDDRRKEPRSHQHRRGIQVLTIDA